MTTTARRCHFRSAIAAAMLPCAALDATLSAPVYAQGMLEEVIVTARKREESLQETPIAVTALSGDDLQELGLRDIADLRKVAPNVDLYGGNGTGGAGNIFIRGVGARNTGVNFDSGVGIYVDGVYVSRPDGTVLDNVDLQSIQVLRGPQGTLFGKNTTGGAILYTTNKPVDEFEGHAEVRAGNYHQLDGKFTVNVPLAGDSLLSRFSVYSTTRDGYVKSRANGNPGMTDGEEYSDVDRKGAQAQLRWNANEDLTLDLNYRYDKTDQSARGQNCELVDDIPGSGWQADLQNQFIVVPSTGKTIQEWCSENQSLGKDKIQTDLRPNQYETEADTLSLTVDWGIGDTASFKSITAWRSTEAGEANELDSIGIPLLHRTNFGWSHAEPRTTDAYSQEFQLAGSAFSDRMDYVVGVFGFTEESDAGTQVSPTGPFFGALFNPLQAFYNTGATEILTENTSASVFSQVDWNFTDHWRLTLGVRYTWEERELERHFRVPDIDTVATTGDAFFSLGNQFILFPSGPETYNPDHRFVLGEDPENPGQPDPLADQRMKVDNDDVTPMASLQYTFEDAGFINAGTIYATVSNGFLSGGITDTISVVTREIEEFDPEEVWNYELGLKLDAWDRRLRMNVAMFYTDYEDRQLTTVRISPDTGRIAGALINAKSSSIAGIEIETQIIPVENLQITANVTFNDGEIDEFDDERILGVPDSGVVPPECQSITVGTGAVMNCPIDRSDENLPRLPEQIYYLAAQYNWETGFGRVIPMVSWSYRADVDNCFDRSSCLSELYLVDQEDLSARLTWFSPEQNLRITAYGNNLTDERYIIGGTPLVDVTQMAGTIYNLPRTYGVEIAYDF
jgi:iron complex outermembrane receptor protein